jgi:putative membrane protein
MMSYPILIVARRMGKSWVFLYGGIGLMTWDLFLDPQTVSAHRWRWLVHGRSTPFAPETPLSNRAGWLLCRDGLNGTSSLGSPQGATQKWRIALHS